MDFKLVQLDLCGHSCHPTLQEGGLGNSNIDILLDVWIFEYLDILQSMAPTTHGEVIIADFLLARVVNSMNKQTNEKQFGRPDIAVQTFAKR